LGFQRAGNSTSTGATLKLHDKENNLSFSCNVMEIGTFAPETRTWLWAWSNKWLPPKLKERALPLKELQEITGREFFGLDVPFSADQAMAWQLAAVSIRHLSSLGCFKAPLKDGRLHAFLAFDAVDRRF
jgi:hypothetical protein